MVSTTCRLALPALSQKWGIPCGDVGRFWQASGPEWDIISQSLDDTHLIIGEVKWTEKEPSAEYIYKAIKELKNKGIPSVKRAPNSTPYYLLFVPEKPNDLTLSDSVRVVEAKEVIDALR